LEATSRHLASVVTLILTVQVRSKGVKRGSKTLGRKVQDLQHSFSPFRYWYFVYSSRMFYSCLFILNIRVHYCIILKIRPVVSQMYCLVLSNHALVYTNEQSSAEI